MRVIVRKFTASSSLLRLRTGFLLPELALMNVCPLALLVWAMHVELKKSDGACQL